MQPLKQRSNSEVHGKEHGWHNKPIDNPNKVLYAGTPAGLSFLNLEAFGGWGQRSLTGHVTALALDGENKQVLWVGTADGHLFRSPDRGVTWR